MHEGALDAQKNAMACGNCLQRRSGVWICTHEGARSTARRRHSWEVGIAHPGVYPGSASRTGRRQRPIRKTKGARCLSEEGVAGGTVGGIVGGIAAFASAEVSAAVVADIVNARGILCPKGPDIVVVWVHGYALQYLCNTPMDRPYHPYLPWTWTLAPSVAWSHQEHRRHQSRPVRSRPNRYSGQRAERLRAHQVRLRLRGGHACTPCRCRA